MRRQRSGSVMRYTIIAAVLACGVTASCSSAPQDFTVHGTVEVAVQSYDEFQQDYPWMMSDTGQVTITDPSGKVIAVATADNGNVNQGPSQLGDMTLTAGFTAKVPSGLSFYGISVTGGQGAPVQFTEAQMKAGPGVCVGDACNG